MPVEVAQARLSDGGVFLFEDDFDPDSIVKVAAVSGVSGQIDFEGALQTIKEAAAKLGATLADIPKPPESYEITFGIKLSAAAGVVLARAGAEANFTVKMSWAAKKV